MPTLLNELSNNLRQLLKKNTTFPMNVSCQNYTKGMLLNIQFNNHLEAGITTCHKDFPIKEWDRKLHQAEITIPLWSI